MAQMMPRTWFQVILDTFIFDQKMIKKRYVFSRGGPRSQGKTATAERFDFIVLKNFEIRAAYPLDSYNRAIWGRENRSQTPLCHQLLSRGSRATFGQSEKIVGGECFAPLQWQQKIIPSKIEQSISWEKSVQKSKNHASAAYQTWICPASARRGCEALSSIEKMSKKNKSFFKPACAR